MTEINGSRTRRAEAGLVVVAVVWGATFTLTKAALAHIDASSFLFLRFGIAALALALYMALSSGLTGLKPTRADLKWGLVLGGLMWIGYFSQTEGLRFVSASVSGLLTGLSVVIVPFASRLFNRPVHKRAVAASIIALAGSALVAGFGRIGNPEGVVLTLVCAIAFALQIAVTDLCIGFTDARRLVLIQLSVVALLSLLGASFSGVNVAVAVTAIGQPSVAAALFVNALLGTTVAYLVQTHVQRILSATQVGVIVSLEPGFALIVSWLVGYVPTGLEVVGACLILAGVVFASL